MSQPLSAEPGVKGREVPRQGLFISGPQVDIPEKENQTRVLQRPLSHTPSFLPLRAHAPSTLPAPPTQGVRAEWPALPRDPPGGNLFPQPSLPTSSEPCFLGALLGDPTSDPDQDPTGDSSFLLMLGHGRPPNFSEDTLWEPQELRAYLFKKSLAWWQSRSPDVIINRATTEAKHLAYASILHEYPPVTPGSRGNPMTETPEVKQPAHSPSPTSPFFPVDCFSERWGRRDYQALKEAGWEGVILSIADPQSRL